MVEFGNQKVLLLFGLLRCGDVANKSRCPSSVAAVERNTNQRQRQYGETRHGDADCHQTGRYGEPSHYYGRIAYDRGRSHSGEVMAKDRERKKKRSLQTLK